MFCGKTQKWLIFFLISQALDYIEWEVWWIFIFSPDWAHFYPRSGGINCRDESLNYAPVPDLHIREPGERYLQFNLMRSLGALSIIWGYYSPKNLELQ